MAHSGCPLTVRVPVTAPIDERGVILTLVGLPGCGKSTVGKQLARRLNLPFTDSDHAIEQRTGCSIRDFFDREGEAAFRDVEESVIAELTQGPPGVLATGGGAVLRPANRERLRQAGSVIYLSSTPEELFRRLRQDTKRPLLQVADPLQRLRDLHAARDPLYRETAHFIIETGRPSVATLVNMILMQLEMAGVLPARPNSGHARSLFQFRRSAIAPARHSARRAQLPDRHRLRLARKPGHLG
jgi:shikimate kinase